MIGRSVEEILVGWNILAGYMWPHVPLTCPLSPLIVGTILHPRKMLTLIVGSDKPESDANSSLVCLAGCAHRSPRAVERESFCRIKDGGPGGARTRVP